MSDKMNLHQKLVEIRKSIKGFHKDAKAGSGSYVGYEYVSGSQVLRAIKEKMDELGVILVPEIDYDTMKWEKHQYKTAKGVEKTDFIITMKMIYTWVNAEFPDDKITVPWVCIGQQTDDIAKAVGTAMTYNERYFLLKSLGLPTDEDDADAKEIYPVINKSSDGFGNLTFKPTVSEGYNNDYVITENQLKRLITIGSNAGITYEAIKTQVIKEFGIEPKQLKKSQYDNICSRLEAKAKK